MASSTRKHSINLFKLFYAYIIASLCLHYMLLTDCSETLLRRTEEVAWHTRCWMPHSLPCWGCTPGSTRSLWLLSPWLWRILRILPSWVKLWEVLLEHAGPVIGADGHVVKIYLFIAAVVEFLPIFAANTSMRSSSSPNRGSAVLKSDYFSD